MHEYKPRGIVKWAPFAALTDYTDAVHELYERLEAEEVEARNLEFEEYLDECLNTIIVGKTDIYIKYRIENELKDIGGLVTRLTKDTIMIYDKVIFKNSIVDIQI